MSSEPSVGPPGRYRCRLGLGGARPRPPRSRLPRSATSTRSSTSAGSFGCGLDDGRRRAGRRRLGLERASAARPTSRTSSRFPPEQLQVGVEPVRAGPQRLDQRAQLGLHRVEPLEHHRRRLGDVADVLARLRRGLLARGLRLAGGLGADLAGLLLGLALDLGGARLGRLDDRAHLVAGRRGERLGALARRALELLELVRERAQVRIDRLGVVAPAADWEVLLLDALSFQGHANQPPSQ